jgi:hypothetical protein
LRVEGGIKGGVLGVVVGVFSYEGQLREVFLYTGRRRMGISFFDEELLRRQND